MEDGGALIGDGDEGEVVGIILLAIRQKESKLSVRYTRSY
jgi:hypothetical protein